MWKRDRDGGPEKSDGDEQKKEMEDNYRNTESRDREFNYKVFKIFRSFHCVSGATAFYYWWLSPNCVITCSLMEIRCVSLVSK